MKNTLIKAILVTACLAVLTCSAAEISSNNSPVIVTVIEKRITAAEVGLHCDANNQPIIPTNTASTCLLRNPLDELLVKIEREITRDYIEKNNLKATDEEIREFKAFQDRFMAKNRIERQAQLAALDKQLQDPKLGPKEKEQTENSRAILLRLAVHDKQRDEMNYKPTIEELREIAGPWIEGWKFNKSIYDTYGGTVGITKFGPDPVGAIKCLLENYEKQGKLVIYDDDLRHEFWKRLSLPPKLTAKPEEVDFIPYWKKPPSQNAK